MKKFAANNGFTLIELMITLVVVIILVSIAAPSFNAMIRDNRLATEANNFLGSLQLAKSEAIRRGVQVTMLR
ncbi:pilus assembly FimT family protein, partial [Methylophaga sp. UBA3595]